MADEIYELIRKVLESLFVLLDGRPVWESIRNFFGLGESGRNEFIPSAVFFAISFLVGISGFVLFLILMRRGDKRKKNFEKKAPFTSKEAK